MANERQSQGHNTASRSQDKSESELIRGLRLQLEAHQKEWTSEIEKFRGAAASKQEKLKEAEKLNEDLTNEVQRLNTDKNNLNESYNALKEEKDDLTMKMRRLEGENKNLQHERDRAQDQVSKPKSLKRDLEEQNAFRNQKEEEIRTLKEATYNLFKQFQKRHRDLCDALEHCSKRVLRPVFQDLSKFRGDQAGWSRKLDELKKEKVGRLPAIMYPNPDFCEAVVAIKNSGLNLEDIDYAERHQTDLDQTDLDERDQDLWVFLQVMNIFDVRFEKKVLELGIRVAGQAVLWPPKMEGAPPLDAETRGEQAEGQAADQKDKWLQHRMWLRCYHHGVFQAKYAPGRLWDGVEEGPQQPS